MDRAGKDVLSIIAMKLDLPAILKWCETNKGIYNNLCDNKDFWLNRLDEDYGNWKNFNSKSFSIMDLHPRERYVFLYQLSLIKKLLNSKESIYDIFLKKEIDLSKKGLVKIPAFNLPNLEDLNLGDNQLTQIPALNLPNLRILWVFNNQLKEIPQLNLPNLENLNLSKNQLKEIPQLNLPNLRTFYLDNNQLIKIPQLNLPNLRFLHLSNNQLTEIPQLNLPNLQRLYLAGNNLTEDSKEELREKYRNVIIYFAYTGIF